jgi:hypothetical protein
MKSKTVFIVLGSAAAVGAIWYFNKDKINLTEKKNLGPIIPLQSFEEIKKAGKNENNYNVLPTGLLDLKYTSKDAGIQPVLNQQTLPVEVKPSVPTLQPKPVAPAPMIVKPVVVATSSAAKLVTLPTATKIGTTKLNPAQRLMLRGLGSSSYILNG